MNPASRIQMLMYLIEDEMITRDQAIELINSSDTKDPLYYIDWEQGWDPLDAPVKAFEEDFCTCKNPVPHDIGVMRSMVICKTCEKDIKDA